MSLDPYAELGVPHNADQDAIKAAHRRKIKKAHPDAGGSPEEFDRAQRSYLVLSDPSRRDHYDRTGQTETDSVAQQEAAITNAILSIMEQVVQNEQLDIEFTDIKQMIKVSVAATMTKIDEEVLATSRKLARLDKLEKRFTRKAGRKGADAQVGLFAMAMKQQRLKLQGHLDMAQKAKVLHEQVQGVFEAFDYDFNPRQTMSGFSGVSLNEQIIRQMWDLGT